MSIKRSLLLMGESELHQEAFKPVAGKMKLYGGGGGKGDNGAAQRAADESKRQKEAYDKQIAQLQAASTLEAAKSQDNVVKVEAGGGNAPDINFGDAGATGRKRKASSGMASSLGVY